MRGNGVVIVGGGLASQRCLETLRARGYEGRVAMVCGEGMLPYDRPPLSKELLAGKLDESEIGFRPARWYADHRVELIFRRAAGLDAKRRRVRLDDGGVLAYEDLVIATGSAPRILSIMRVWMEPSPSCETEAPLSSSRSRLHGADQYT